MGPYAMRRLLIGLTPWMAMTTAWAQDARPVSIVYTYLSSVSDGPVRVGDECYVPPNLASKWGWDIHLNDSEADIEAEGRHIRVYSRVVSGRPLIPVIAACYQLGADAEWDAKGTSLRVLGIIRNVEFTKDGIRVDSTLTVSSKKFSLDNPERLIVDFKGAKLWRGATEDVPGGIRIKQFGSDAVRLVVERPGASKLPVKDASPSRSYALKLVENKVATPTYDPLPRVPPAQVVPGGSPATDAAAGQTAPTVTVDPTRISGAIQLQTLSDTEAWLSIPLSKPLPNRPSGGYTEPTKIELFLPSVAAPADQPQIDKSDFVESVETFDDGKGSTRVVITTTKAFGFLLSQEGSVVKLRLLKPKSSNGKLAGKTIVVDAGHGGEDAGTQWSKPPVNEKDLTLKIARQLARQLSSEGAAVIMTRNDDTKIPLKERPAIATRSKADIFVSIHINSNQLNNSRSGTITFFHNQNPICMLLAECIQSEIVKVSGLPGMGTWSDTRIYSSGFSVLRNATVPAVLVECGFLNHQTDRARMVTAEFQTAVASAIVKGLKVFMGDAQNKEASK